MPQLMPIRLERLNCFMLFTLLLTCYVYTFPRWADPNQNSRLDMVVSVVDDGTFQIDKYVANTVDYAKVGEHYYSDKAPGVAFIGIPVYTGLKLALNLPIASALTERLAHSAAFQSTLRENGSGVSEQKVRFALSQVTIALVVGAIPSAILGVLMYLWLAHITANVWLRMVAVLGYSLLTPAYAYANTLYGHQLSAALLFGAFYMISTTSKPLSISPLLGVGILLGYSVVTEYPTALMAGILYLYTYYRLHRLGQARSIIWVTLSTAIVAMGWMAYNNTVFGGPLELGYSYSELWVEKHHTGFMSLTLPRWDAIWGITFGVFRGLFVLAPWLLLAVPGFVIWWRSSELRAEFVVALAGVIAIFLFNASSVMWWGGFAVGPRYLLPALPFLSLGAVFILRQWGSRLWLKAMLYALLAWSFVATWGLTLAEQAFPPDTIRNPVIEYALPNWLAGNIARNVGTIMGLRGALSLTPLLVLLFLGLTVWRLLVGRVDGAALRDAAAEAAFQAEARYSGS